MDNLILVLVILTISGLHWLFTEGIKKMRRGVGQPPPPTPGVPRPPAQARRRAAGPPRADDDIRRFLEAMGLPEDAVPPPPVFSRQEPESAWQPPSEPELPTPRPQPIRRVEAPVRSPAAEPVFERYELPVDTMRREREEDRAAELREHEREVQVYKQRSRPLPKKPQPKRRSASEPRANVVLIKRLRDPDGLRSAVLAREVLGPPVGLR